jgi:hypothetical protein
VVTQDVVSAGGFPVDSNGLALTRNANTQSSSMMVSNYVSGLLPEINIRGYGQNRPGGAGATTSAAPGINFEGSRGTAASPTVTGSGDAIFAISGGGYDGARWSNDINIHPIQIAGIAAEAFSGNATTATNHGSRLLIRAQPVGVQLNSTSRQSLINQTWTAAAGTSPPIMILNFGNGGNDTPTLITSSGTSTWTGFGATTINKINSKNFIVGVPAQDSAPDNSSLTATNVLTFASGRRSGASGRRDALLASDSLGVINFNGQIAASGTTGGSRGGQITATATENFGAGARGTRITINTVNSGTTTESARLTLDDRKNDYAATAHNFYLADGTTSVANFSAATITLTASTIVKIAAADLEGPTGDDFNIVSDGTANINLNADTVRMGDNNTTATITTHGTADLALNPSSGKVLFSRPAVLKGFQETKVAETYTATYAPDVSTATIMTMTLTGGVTFNGFTSPLAGQSATVIFTQDGTGGRTLTSTMKFAGGSKTLSTAASAVDIISVFYDGTNYWASLSKGYA